MHWERATLVTLCSSCLTCTSWLKSESRHLSSMFLLEFTSLLFYFDLSFTILSLFFPLLHFELHTELDNLIAMQNLRNSAHKGSDDAYDVSVSLTGYEPYFMAFSELNESSGSFSYIIPSSDQDMDDVTLGKLLTEAHWGQADYFDPEGVSVSQSSSSVVFDRAGKTCGRKKCRSINWFWRHEKHVQCSQQVSENTQAEKMVDRSGNLEEPNSSNAQIRTLFEEQRQMIIAEKCEKIGHHELQAAHAEEERRILGEEIWRQKLDFREVHQQSLIEMEELRKFQSSTFDTLARRKLIEDQNTILELSGIVQELQNEVNCMNDSKDFQDAESVHSGKSTSRLKWLGQQIHGIHRLKSRSIHPQWRKVIDRNEIKIWDASLDRQPKIQSSSVEETLQRIMGQTNNDCRFLIFTLTSSFHQQPLLAGR